MKFRNRYRIAIQREYGQAPHRKRRGGIDTLKYGCHQYDLSSYQWRIAEWVKRRAQIDVVTEGLEQTEKPPRVVAKDGV